MGKVGLQCVVYAEKRTALSASLLKLRRPGEKAKQLDGLKLPKLRRRKSKLIGKIKSLRPKFQSLTRVSRRSISRIVD
jgi:hypothetical protein